MVEDSLRRKGLTIRTMQESDLPSIVKIERLSFSTPWSETSFFNEIYKQRSIPKVAVIDDRIAGYICANHVADEGHILNLAVHPDFRGKGIANTLVENILEELKENACRFLYLEVRASNNAARKLYEGFGFSVVGTRKEYYTEPKEDAVIMMLRL
ncbi:MAG TPA: ribosomal-protein-alanine N-acetyltransferase [Nitrospiraceae bacterium]|nr:ribosomal-protein-alanine N-acetyltransferase [Nitrospiraceae bacterium]HBU05973.1 ribosomal-protein-alanine N-acetyltransferase [Nitrospiraceae bacterium]